MRWWDRFLVRCGAAALSGLLIALAYPPMGWGWLVLPGLAGFFLSIRGQRGTRVRGLGFLHGMVAFGVGLSWLVQVFGTLGVLLFAVLAAFPMLFAHFQSRAEARGIVGWRFAMFTALNWSAWEFIRAELFPLKFPWMTNGLAMGPNAFLPWIGVYGVGAVAVLAVALAIERKRMPALAIAAGLGAAVFGFRPMEKPAGDDPLAIKVGGIQLEGVGFDDLVQATRRLSADIRYVVWPEYSVPYDLRADKRDWKVTRDLCAERNLTLTLGTQNWKDGGEAWRNIALTLDPSGVRGEHNKVHTVHFFNDGKAGRVAVPVETRHGKIGTPVCFDCDYEAVCRGMTRGGAEAFIVPIMDAVSWSARQHEQHAELFRIRACENGRWMFVCATSGISQIIDPHGGMHGSLPALAEGSLTGMIRRESGLTFYTKLGWLVPWLLLALALASWAGVLVKSTTTEGRVDLVDGNA
jgi:apolipoprotein N-acyltransferase